jgi:hypothetical protein
MPDPIDRLALALAPHVFGTAQAPRPVRLRPLLVGRPHPRRRLGRWGGDGVVRLSVQPCAMLRSI